MRYRIAPLILAAVAAAAMAACPRESGSPAATPEPAVEDEVKERTGGAVVAKEGAKDITFDGYRLGDSYAKMFAKAPYDKPCDNDPVDKAKTIRAMVYGGTPCRGNSFAEGTTLLVFIPNQGNDAFDVPIRAVAWVGGSYFDERSSLGLSIKATREQVRERFGEPTSTLDLPDRLPLKVETYSGQIHAIYDGDVAAGYALGPLPITLEEGDEHWRVVSQLYRRYTARVTSRAPSEQTAACEELLAHYVKLMRADPKKAADADELVANKTEAIAQCVKKLGPEDLACALKAATFAEIRACEKR